MIIQKLNITNIRNIESISFQPSPAINLFFGLNGSGKTSLLEAVHILGLARSFQTSKIKPVIRAGAEKYTIFGLIESFHDSIPLSVGVSRRINDSTPKIKIANEATKSSSELAVLIPIQVINPAAFKLLEGSPKLRRGFIDWGVFHVEHRQFFPSWKKMQKALKQRNSLLRQGKIADSELSVWSHSFIESASLVDELRRNYIDRLQPYFYKMLEALCDLKDISISYYRGWDKEQSLEVVLKNGLERDVQSGYTHAGPQRADLRIRAGKHNALDLLSRGQMKLVIAALKLAQGCLLSDITGNNCIFLVDDLTSELDTPHRKAFCCLLQQIKSQVFITCIEKELLAEFLLPNIECKMFHVKQGQIKLIDSPVPAIRQANSLEIEYE